MVLKGVVVPVGGEAACQTPLGCEETRGRYATPQEEDGYRWLEAYPPVAKIGRSILLYYVPDAPPA
jgi:hypothetical protein